MDNNENGMKTDTQSEVINRNDPENQNVLMNQDISNGGNQSKILVSDISGEMKKSYLDYAMSVIVSRALPDVRDGLKPVHRRILYDMFELGIKASGGTKKSARIVGDVLGKYHPHGDASVYDAMVRLAQDFSLRYPVVHPQGNFGSIDGDPPAAYRYTEAKMSRIGELMLSDIEKNTVDFVNNFDDSLQEPSVLPSGFPFMMANGSSGIAVGMATNIAPHNLREICDSLCALIDNPDITILELMNYIKGPDFPTSGIICGLRGVKDSFETGRGKIVLRGRYHIEEHKTHDAIVFTELPYQVNKRDLKDRIEELRKDGTLKDVSLVRDESDREGIRLVIELKAGAVSDIIVNHLFKYTALESNFNVNNLALVDGRPRLLNLKDMLYYYLKHRKEVTTRRTRFDLEKAEAREHILLGLKIGLENIDRVIEIIKASPDNQTANQTLQTEFSLTEIQANAIIQMRLGRLSHLETQEILDELSELEVKIAHYKDLLSDEAKMLALIKEEIQTLSRDYGDDRRTEIQEREISGMIDRDFIKKEDCVVVGTHKGFVKRVPVEEYKSQNRGGMGVRGATLREDDFIEHIFTSNSHDYIMYVSNKGRAFVLETWEIPEGTKTGKGVSLKAVLTKMEPDEVITSVINFSSDDLNSYLLMCTRFGIVKQIQLGLLTKRGKNGVKAIDLDEGDILSFCIFVKSGDEGMIITRDGRGLRFNADSIRSMGRTARGVKGIRLKDGDEVVGLLRVDNNRKVLMVTDTGRGKQVEYDSLNQHGRATGGQIIYKLGEKSNCIVSALSVSDENDIVAITKNGYIIRTHVKDITTQGRNTQGIYVVRLKTDDDKIVSLCSTVYQEEEKGDETSPSEETQGDITTDSNGNES